MKKNIIIGFLMFILYFPVSASATVYLNDDPNYPMTGGHGDYFEYMDLSSCQVSSESDQFWDISVGYIVVSTPALEDPYRIRRFRYWKDGYTRPQFYSPYREAWIDIPSQNVEDVNAFRSINHSYAAYMQRFYPHMFRMLQTALIQLFGIEIYE